MNEIEANSSTGVHLQGIFYLQGNVKANFRGPVKRGLRLILWGNFTNKATSISFVNDLDITIGEKKEIDIIIFSPQSIGKKIRIESVYLVGFPNIKIGEFVVKRIIGKWIGKVP